MLRYLSFMQKNILGLRDSEQNIAATVSEMIDSYIEKSLPTTRHRNEVHCVHVVVLFCSCRCARRLQSLPADTFRLTVHVHLIPHFYQHWLYHSLLQPRQSPLALVRDHGLSRIKQGLRTIRACGYFAHQKQSRSLLWIRNTSSLVVLCTRAVVVLVKHGLALSKLLRRASFCLLLQAVKCTPSRSTSTTCETWPRSVVWLFSIYYIDEHHLPLLCFARRFVCH